MSYCLNRDCPKPSDLSNITNRVCHHCGWEILLQGRYRVIRKLGEGGFSRTFEVMDGDTPKVLKVLSNNHPKAISLFRSEARVLCRLNDRGIPKVLPDGYFTISPRNTREPLHCLVMEKIEGCNLEEWMEARNYRPISQERAIDWLKQLVTILDKVHQKEYFHRDIKLSNIMVRSNEELVLIDFGTAREISGTYLAKVGGGNNVTGIISPGYTPLEQVNGKAVPQSDFFALGRTFVYLLAGKSPNQFTEDSHNGELLWRNSAPQISKTLADFIDYLMAPFPGNRPSSTKVILQHLAEIERNLSANSVPRQLSQYNNACRSIATKSTSYHKISLATIGKSRKRQLPKFAIEFLAVNATLLLGFIGSQVYDYLSVKTYQVSYDRAPNEQKIVNLTGTENNGSSLVLASVGNNTIDDRPSELEFDRSYKTLRGHSNRVNAIAISPDGGTIASSGGDGTIKLWDSATGRQIKTWMGHLNGVNAIAFSPDGELLASAGADNTIKLWNANTGKQLHTLSGHSDRISSIAFSPDSQTIASGSYDNTIKLWDVSTAQLRKTMEGHFSWVFAVAFSPDGQTIASGGYDNTIKLWNAITGEIKETFKSQSLRVRSIAFSPDGQTIASGTEEGTIELRSAISGQILETFEGHKDAVSAIAFSPSGHKIASSSGDRIKIWDTDGLLLDTLNGHRGAIDAIAFSPGTLFLASGSDDSTIKIWLLP